MTEENSVTEEVTEEGELEVPEVPSEVENEIAEAAALLDANLRPKATPPKDGTQEEIANLKNFEESLTKVPAGGETTPAKEGYVTQEEYDKLQEKYEALLSQAAKLEVAHQRYEGTAEGTFHTVAASETRAVRQIAAKYGVSVSLIERLNPGVNVRHLVPRYKLRIK